MSDATTTNHGSIIALKIETQAAKEWVADNLQTEGWQWLGDSLCVEPRFMSQIIDRMQEDGLAIN